MKPKYMRGYEIRDLSADFADFRRFCFFVGVAPAQVIDFIWQAS
jgi:hypothetical protein